MGNPAIHRLFELYESKISKLSVLERVAAGAIELFRSNLGNEATSYTLTIAGKGQLDVPGVHMATALLAGPPYVPTILSLLREQAQISAGGSGLVERSVTPGLLQSMSTDVGVISLFLPDEETSPTVGGNLQIVLANGAAKVQKNFEAGAQVTAHAMRSGISPLRAALESCPAAVEFIGRPDSAMRAAMEHLDLGDFIARPPETPSALDPWRAGGAEPKSAKKGRGL